MKWDQINIPKSSKLCQIHKLTYLHNGATYQLEINEYLDGNCTGFGEHSTDPSQQLKPVSADDKESCLQKLLDTIS